MKNMTQELAHELFEYRDGKLFWKVSPSYKVKAGNIAGWFSGKRRAITINGVKYKEHRIIFLYHHGYLPKLIDHIDGDSLNNKIENLRSATNSENGYNTKILKVNSSGFKNVRWDKRINKWFVQLRVCGKQKYCGSYKDINDAITVAEKMRIKFHGEFARNK